MADDLLTRILKEIDDRKRELAAAVREHNRLEGARVALEGGGLRFKGPRRGTASALQGCSGAALDLRPVAAARCPWR
jgi:hypothetical protein